jgi:hypothetical protein
MTHVQRAIGIRQGVGDEEAAAHGCHIKQGDWILWHGRPNRCRMPVAASRQKKTRHRRAFFYGSLPVDQS